MPTNPSRPDANVLKRHPKLLLATIWTRPTATLRFILHHCPNQYVTALLALGGVARAVDRAASQHGDDYLALAKLSPLPLVLGALSGWLTYYVYGWGLSATGRWLGGAANTSQTRFVLAWGLAPIVAALGMQLLRIAFFNNELFSVDAASFPSLRTYSGNIVLVAQGICTAWALVILSKGLQLVQGFGPGRALLNVLLPGLLLITGIVVLAKLMNF